MAENEIPEQLRDKVLRVLFARFDELKWEELPNADRTRQYDLFAQDDEIGGALSPFKGTHQVHRWIKDGPAKEYRRALEGRGPYAALTQRTSPGPESLIAQILGAEWELKADSVKEKPMRCVAQNEQGATVDIFWAERGSFKELAWAAIQHRAEHPDDRVALAVTKPKRAPLPKNEWARMKAIARVVGSEVVQVTYMIRAKDHPNEAAPNTTR